MPVKITPIRIIILGGVIVTLGYCIWGYLLPDIIGYKQGNLSGIKVKNLFHDKEIADRKNSFESSDSSKKSELETAKKLQLLDENSLTPVTENERQFLITKAKESIENRLDPFAQGVVIMEQIEQQKAEAKAEEGPKEIPLMRKQVELVGIISSNNKDLALVNIYDANYTVLPDDDDDVKKSKLKTAISMAVPNRFEVSLLDPVEDWYVKQVVKGKTRDDEPYIELVRGNKKFKLKVGQKLLLPEQDTM